MDTDITTVSELRSALRLDRRRAWIRLLVGPSEDDTRPLRFGQVLIGPKPLGWEDRTWTYGGWSFTTTEMTARQASELLRADDPKVVDIGELSLSYALNENAQWFHHPSRQDYGGMELSWPSRSVTLSMLDSQQNTPSGYMVGHGPSFPSFAGAYNAFFYDQWTQSGANQGTFGQLALRIVDGRGRIRRTVVHAASLDVWLDGRGVKGCRLELNSATDRATIDVAHSGKLTIPLPSGLGSDTWLWLNDQTGWIDVLPITPWGGRQNPGVTFEASEDRIAEVTALASQGESTFLEYKRDLPEDNLESKRKNLKTVVAFANGEGGTMLYGVDGDDNAGTITGLAGNPAELLRRLNSLVRDRVTPTPRFSITGEVVDGKYTIKLDVEPGGGILYALVLDANRPEYYVRRNGSTYYARPEELAHVLAKSVAQPNRGLAGYLK